jgi:hypothetical protein
VKELEGDLVLVSQPEKSVQAAGMIVIIVSDAPGIDASQGGALADVVPVAENAAGDVGLEAGRSGTLVGGKDQVVDPVPGGEEAESLPADLAGDFAAPERVGHAPGEDDFQRGHEEIGRFQEEGPLFWIIEGEPGVDVQLSGVRLDLGEIRVEGGVEGEVGRQAPAGG